MSLKMHNIDGIDYAQCIVLLLPCNNKSELIIRHSLIYDNNIGLYYKEEHYDLTHQYKNLYILNDEEIKEGDWFLCVSANGWTPIPQKCGGVSEKGYRIAGATNSYTPTKKDFRKIIATTDDSLTKEIDCPDDIEGCEVLHLERLPVIPENFIRHYVDEYNKGNILRSVFVEYDYYPQSGSEQMGGWIRELIINPEEHTISTLILPVKTTWNREELESILFRYAEEHALTSTKSEIDEFNNWIDKNL